MKQYKATGDWVILHPIPISILAQDSFHPGCGIFKRYEDKGRSVIFVPLIGDTVYFDPRFVVRFYINEKILFAVQAEHIFYIEHDKPEEVK